MNRSFSLSFVALVLILGLSACSKMPKHTRLIPKDAVFVAGINTKDLGKKVAWSKIAGSKLLDEMPATEQKNAVKELELAGVEGMSTSYIYVRPDKRYEEKIKIVALVPLSDATKWAAYVKKNFPGTNVQQNSGLSEASFGDKVYAAWNNELLMLSNVITAEQSSMQYAYADSARTEIIDSYQVSSYTPDPAAMSAEMKANFAVTEENSLTSDKRFTKLEQAGHDITMWVNYDLVMSEMSRSNSMMGNFGMSSLWKGSALTAGFDFEQGRITGDMEYYTPEEMKDIYSELARKEVDKKMLERLPGQNLSLVAGYYMSPKGIKMLMEKMGLLGLANLGLASQGISLDQILEGFSGDIVLGMNDFNIRQTPVDPTDSNSYAVSAPSFNFILAFKLNKKDNIENLLKMLVGKEVLRSPAPGVYMAANEEGSQALVVEGEYAVVANTTELARAYAAGTAAKTPLPEAASREVKGHPFGMFLNIQTLLQGAQASGTGSRDSFMIASFRNVFDNVSFNGGAFRNNVFTYHMSANMINKQENSLVQLISLAQQLNEGRSRYGLPDYSGFEAEAVPADAAAEAVEAATETTEAAH